MVAATSENIYEICAAAWLPSQVMNFFCLVITKLNLLSKKTLVCKSNTGSRTAREVSDCPGLSLPCAMRTSPGLFFDPHAFLTNLERHHFVHHERNVLVAFVHFVVFPHGFTKNVSAHPALPPLRGRWSIRLELCIIIFDGFLGILLWDIPC